MRLVDSFWDNHNRLLAETRESLTQPFSTQEIEEAFKDMKEDAAPGPNGFISTFFKIFWDLVKEDILTYSQTSMQGGWI